ncbi:cytochrome P450 [Streptomyces sp. NPDC026673]|uniref:cytochrome P450 n=1 Tax=Streptomyces sp. NPDC026673 TaxID=3155724 RepID=UPI0033CA0706
MTVSESRGFVVTDREPRCPFDPSARLVAMRESGRPAEIRVSEAEYGEVDMLLVTRYEDVRAVFGDRKVDHSFVPGPAGEDGISSTQPGFLPRYNGAEHQRLRRLVMGTFMPKSVAAMRPMIERVVREKLDAIAAAGPETDLVTSYALSVPSSVIGHILGVPEADHEHFNAISAGVTDVSLSRDEAMAAFMRLNTYVAGLVADNRANPGDGLIGRLVTGQHGEATDEELIGILGILVVAGHETTAAMIGLSALALMQQPDQLAALLDPEHSTADAVEELLRYLSISGTMPRAVAEDMSVAGHPLKAGDRVLVSALTANRDPEFVENPDVLDLTRAPSAHVTFGYGIHQCVGQHLARLELQVALPALFERFPGLKPAVPAEELRYSTGGNVYALESLPVSL